MSDPIRVNGNIFSWGSITIKVDDQEFYGFTEIKYSQKRTRTKIYGTGKDHAPRGRSRGKYEVDDGSLKGPKGTMQDLREALAAKASDSKSYGNTEFPVVINYVESDETPITVELLRCAISSEDSDESESPDPLQETVGISIMAVKRNGLTLFDNTDGRY